MADRIEAGEGVRGAVALALAGMLVFAGDAGAQANSAQATLNTRLTYTDNARAGRDKRSDLVAEVSPGLVVSRESGRFQGWLNSRFRTLTYLEGRSRDTSYLALGGRGQFEAVENRLFFDMDASISRRSRSAFSGRDSEDEIDADSDNENRLFSFGPRWHFSLGGDARGMASYKRRWFDGGQGLGRREVDEWRGQASDPTAFGRWGWGVTYDRTDSRYPNRADAEASLERARGTVYLTVSPQLRLRGIVGHEANEFSRGQDEDGTIVGAGFDWQPTPRTRVSGTVEDRVFGTGYDLTFQHRRARSAYELSYARDITSSLQTFGSVFDDPAFRLLYDGLASAIPDPVERELFVRELLGYSVPGFRDDFLTNAHFLNRRLRAGLSLFGRRDTLSFSLSRSTRERLTEVSALRAEDDFSIFNRVETDTASVSLHHRMTPITGLTGRVSRSQSRGSGTTRGDVERTRLSLRLTTRLGPSVTGGLSYSYQRAEGTTDFTENTVSANLNMRF